MNVDGNPVEAVVFSGYDLQHGFTYGTPVAQTATSTWLHRILGIPQLAPGSIVRDRTGGKAWLIDTQGFLREMADTEIFFGDFDLRRNRNSLPWRLLALAHPRKGAQERLFHLLDLCFPSLPPRSS